MNNQKKEKKEYMNLRYFLRKNVFAVLFLAFILGYASLNMAANYRIYYDALLKARKEALKNPMGMPVVIHELEDTLNTELLERMKFLEVFSFTQKVLDKREINNFSLVKDETGSMHYASFYKEHEQNCFEYALRVKRLKDKVSQYGTDVIFVVPPSKFVTEDNRLRADMPVNDPQIVVDETLFFMNRLGIDTLDLNMYLPSKTVPYEDAFFKTDHHWTIPAAFEATRIFADTLNEKFGYGLEVDKYLSKEMYTSVVYTNGMLGSMGRKSGACFSDVEDITIIYPKFDATIERIASDEHGGTKRDHGGIIGTLILPEVLQREELYTDSQYSVYMNGVRSFDYVRNESNPDGKKFFMIRDSYFSPVISFLAPMTSEIDAVWSLAKPDIVNIEEALLSDHYDCVVVEMYPYGITDEAFQFFVEEE